MILLLILRRACVVVGFFALAGLVLLPSTQIVLRTVFAVPILGLEEVTRYLLIVVTFVGLPLVTAEDRQIRMDELLGLMPISAAALLKVTIAIVSAATLATVLVAVYSSVELTIGSSTPTVGIPFWLFNLPAIIGLGVGVIEFARQAWRTLGGRHERQPPQVV